MTLPNNIKDITLEICAFCNSKIQDLDVSNLSGKLFMYPGIFKNSAIHKISLPHTSKIEFRNKTANLSEIDFLGCGNDVEISKSSDFILDVPEMDFLDELEEEDYNDDNDNNIQGFNLDKNELMNILTKKYPLFAQYIDPQIDANKAAAEEQSLQKIYHTTFRELSKERAEIIANTAILLDKNDYPTKGHIADSTNCQTYQLRDNDILRKEGLEYYPTISSLKEDGSYTTTAPSAYNDRIVVTNYGVYLKQHHYNLPESLLCLFGKHKGKIRLCVSFENRQNFRWAREYKG